MPAKDLTNGDDTFEVNKKIRANWSIYGYAGDDQIKGGYGDDTIRAGIGDDILDGVGGNDYLYGGNGDDLYKIHVLTQNAQIFEAFNQGIDTVQSTRNYTLPNNVENLILKPFESSYSQPHPDNDDFTSTTSVFIANPAQKVGRGNELDNVIRGVSSDSYSNELHGLAGNDSLYGGAGQDRLLGGADDDQIQGGAGKDQIEGGIGNDFIDGGSGEDNVLGGKGSDRINGGAGIDTIFANSGNDTIIMSGAEGEFDEISGGPGYDTLLFTTFTNTLDGFVGNANVGSPNNGIELIQRESDREFAIIGNDTANRFNFLGTDFINLYTVNGLGGDDEIYGKFDAAAADVNFMGGSGTDTLFGGGGNDILNGGADADADTVYGNKGSDLIIARGREAEFDTLHGHGPSSSWVFGADDGATDTLGVVGGAAVLNRFDSTQNSIERIRSVKPMTYRPDQYEASIIPVNIFGNDGANYFDFSQTQMETVINIMGGGGADTIIGSADNNQIFGGQGSDSLTGGGGRDRLVGYGGDNEQDVLTGGRGADIFVLGDSSGTFYEDEGHAIITDFVVALGDRIQISGPLSDYRLDQSQSLGGNSLRRDTAIYQGSDLIGVVEDRPEIVLSTDYFTPVA